MKICFFMVCLMGTMTQKVLAQKNTDAARRAQQKQEKYGDDFPDFDRYLLLEEKVDTTANVSVSDSTAMAIWTFS